MPAWGNPAQNLVSWYVHQAFSKKFAAVLKQMVYTSLCGLLQYILLLRLFQNAWFATRHNVVNKYKYISVVSYL